MSINLPSSKQMTGIAIVFGCLCGLIGWAVIELIIWLFSFIEISIVSKGSE